MGKKKLLTDVVIIRPLIIGLLVVYHAFIIYMGGWREPVGFKPVEAYGWIADFLHSFRMQVIIFIAGYVYSYQISLGKNESLKNIVVKKFKRLILPSVFFSLIYFFLFCDFERYTVGSTLVTILSGAGHMWFLPMLFWCFGCGKLLVCSKLNEFLVLFLLACIALVPWSVPFGIGNALRYMVFFWLGVVVWRHHDYVVAKFCTGRFSLFAVVLFVVSYLLSRLYQQVGLASMVEPTMFWRLLHLVVDNAVALVVTLLGIGMVYVVTNYFVEYKHCYPASWVFTASTICYGVYIYQQFILQILYYKTGLPEVLGPYLLPWVGVVVTLVLSVVLTRLTLKTRFGRFLIG